MLSNEFGATAAVPLVAVGDAANDAPALKSFNVFS